jgi:uncharacterized phage protein (TIGR01671 family)
MMEIKFKGKRVDNGEWVYGYYVFRPDGKHLIYWKPFDEASQNTYHEVDPETVGQFTGLHDSEGKEIYEGDVVANPETGKELGEVVFGDIPLGSDDYSLKFATVGFAIKYNDGSGYTGLTKVESSYGYEPRMVEVIGNIHDEVKK